MHKNATKCNKTQSKWCKNKHGASKIIDMFETYHGPRSILLHCYYCFPFTCFIYILANYYLLPKSGFDLDGEGRIRNLIWTTRRSRWQYTCFGDVVVFDTTYTTNLYKMPFGLFVGVNNHYQAVIYAGILMVEETVEGFNWAYTEFVSLMGGKAPVTMLTGNYFVSSSHDGIQCRVFDFFPSPYHA
jgi:hypothetical protein